MEVNLVTTVALNHGKLNSEKYRGKIFDGFNRIEHIIGVALLYSSK